MRCDTSRFSTSLTAAAAASCGGGAKSLLLVPEGALSVDAFAVHSAEHARDMLEVLMDTGCSPATPISYDLVLQQMLLSCHRICSGRQPNNTATVDTTVASYLYRSARIQSLVA